MGTVSAAEQAVGPHRADTPLSGVARRHRSLTINDGQSSITVVSSIRVRRVVKTSAV